MIEKIIIKDTATYDNKGIEIMGWIIQYLHRISCCGRN